MRQPEIGKKIVELRKAKGLTQEELAFLCEINVRSVQRIESGEVNPRAFTVGLLSKSLDFDFLSIDKKNLLAWRVMLHLSNMMPVFIFPIFMLVMKKDEYPEIEKECRDVINFQLSMYIYLFLLASANLFFFKNIAMGILFMILWGISLWITTIINTIRVALDLDYYYPGAIKFLK